MNTKGGWKHCKKCKTVFTNCLCLPNCLYCRKLYCLYGIIALPWIALEMVESVGKVQVSTSPDQNRLHLNSQCCIVLSPPSSSGFKTISTLSLKLYLLHDLLATYGADYYPVKVFLHNYVRRSFI